MPRPHAAAVSQGELRSYDGKCNIWRVGEIPNANYRSTSARKAAGECKDDKCSASSSRILTNTSYKLSAYGNQ
ncbi:OSJNBa0043A12.15-like protein [Zea mays]|uniref:OSJNBa0043A12.15-like protein n=1 Tax=Zea mays TaxID=4577 RepID=A0A1D6DU85_MAIZE|nr:OSJNBa0043A12.15-like protein [Zea mays]